MYTLSHLLNKRGWSEKAVERFLGAPDERRANPHGGAAVKLYSCIRVKQAEETVDPSVWKRKTLSYDSIDKKEIALEIIESFRASGMAREEFLALMQKHIGQQTFNNLCDAGGLLRLQRAVDKWQPALFENFEIAV